MTSTRVAAPARIGDSLIADPGLRAFLVSFLRRSGERRLAGGPPSGLASPGRVPGSATILVDHADGRQRSPAT